MTLNIKNSLGIISVLHTSNTKLIPLSLLPLSSMPLNSFQREIEFTPESKVPQEGQWT